MEGVLRKAYGRGRCFAAEKNLHFGDVSHLSAGATASPCGAASLLSGAAIAGAVNLASIFSLSASLSFLGDKTSHLLPARVRIFSEKRMGADAVLLPNESSLRC